MGQLNQLSQLLYWGNVLGNLGGLLVLFGFLFLFAAFVATIIFFCMNETSEKGTWIPAFFAPLFFVLVISSWAGAAFCPSQETVYAIAASQMGEQALKTPLASKASRALESWLDKQIGAPAVEHEENKTQ